MEITDLVEKNSTLLRLGLHLEFNDARHRVAAHLQRNIDRSEYRDNFIPTRRLSKSKSIYPEYYAKQNSIFRYNTISEIVYYLNPI